MDRHETKLIIKGGPTARDVKIYDENGKEWNNVSLLDIRIRPDEIITAKMEVFVSELDLEGVKITEFESKGAKEKFTYKDCKYHGSSGRCGFGHLNGSVGCTTEPNCPYVNQDTGMCPDECGKGFGGDHEISVNIDMLKKGD